MKVGFHHTMVALLLFMTTAKAQSDSLYFNLYTDSLKKGSWNYINVELQDAGGGIVPLSTPQVEFKSDHGKWEGNSLWIDWDFPFPHVVVEARYQSKSDLFCRQVIGIRQRDDPKQPSKTDSLLFQLNERNRQKNSRTKKAG